jgi:hypothetical protein
MTTLTAVTLLSTVAAPAVGNYIDLAREVKAQHDARSLATSFLRLINDVGHQRRMPGGWARYELLVSPGQVPRAGTPEAARWTLDGSRRVGLLDEHLNTNGPGYQTKGAPSGFGWRGAYLQDPVAADPWGNRYAVNVAALEGAFTDTVVLSAGPDGIASSPFMSDGLPTAGDDVTAHVASAGLAR